MAKRYKRKPVIIEALQYDGYNKIEVEEFIGTHCAEYVNTLSLGEEETFLATHINGEFFAVNKGSYIIKDQFGINTMLEEHFNEVFESLD